MSELDQLISGVSVLADADMQIGDVWRMPTPVDCVSFALTEYGELVNDQINMKSAGYARNHMQRSPDMVKELTDVGMMLLKYFLSVYKGEAPTIEAIKNKAKEVTDENNNLVLPPAFVTFLKSFGIDPQAISDITKIGMLVTYAMALIEAHGPGADVETVIVTALMLVAGHELFAEHKFVTMLTNKINATIKKVTTREMNIV